MITLPQPFLFSPVFLGLILRVSSFNFFYTTSLLVSFYHLFTNRIIVNCFCTVCEGLIFTAQEGQLAWLSLIGGWYTVSGCCIDGPLSAIIASIFNDVI